MFLKEAHITIPLIWAQPAAVVNGICSLDTLKELFDGQIWTDIYLCAGESMSILTGITHDRPGRFFTLAHHQDSGREAEGEFALPQHRREQIAREAIIAAARGARIDEGDIRHIMSQTVDQRGLGVTDIMVRAASLAEQYTGRQPFNWSSANPDQVQRYLASLGLEPGWRRAMREAEMRARSGRDSTAAADDRDEGLSGSSGQMYLHSAAGRAMQAYAREHGLGWAVDRPEILQMGHEAIRLLARTGFTRESFDRLKEVGFDRRDILHLVKRAEESGQDANELAQTTRDTVRILGGGNPQREQEIRTALAAFHERPTDAGAWQRLDEVLRRYETEGTPEQQDQAKKQREAEEKIRQVNAEIRATTAVESTATAEATAATTTHAVAQQDTANVVDDLNSPAPPGTAQQPAPPPQSQPQPTRHVAGPR